MWPWALTLTLDFQGQILKKSVSQEWEDRFTWNERDVSRYEVGPHCDFEVWPYPWPWPWILKVKFWKRCISGMGGLINMEQKGCESIECWTHYVTLSYGLGLGLSGSNCEITIFQEWEGWLTWNKRDVSRWVVGPTMWPWPLTLPMTLGLGFSKWNFQITIS